MRDAGIQPAFNEALSLHRAGHFSRAEKLYRHVLGRVPEHSDALHLLGYLRFQTGDSPMAIELIRRAIGLRPDYPAYHNNLGTILEKSGQLDAAAEAYRAALRLDRAYAEAHNNLGNVLQAKGQVEAAIGCYQTALECNPRYFPAHFNLGNLLKEAGKIQEAIAAYRRAIELEPGLPAVHSNLLLALHYDSGSSALDLADEHRRWSERHVSPLGSEPPTHANSPDEQRRLRVGYVSPDFCQHAVARFLLPLLTHHDRGRFEIFAYSNVAAPDQMTARIKSLVDGWRDIAQLADAQLADLVRKDQIDILVDLAGHTSAGRLLAFARRPAPVQVFYLAYCSTTGISQIDYRLTDPHLDPEGSDLSWYAERTVRLPSTYWCYAAPEVQVEVGPAPAGRDGPITFGSLNNSCKITREALGVWGRILSAVSESRLVLFARTEYQRRHIRESLHAAGVDTARLHFVGRQCLSDYLATYGEVDIALDPIPFTGGTTTCDALWMGVPVVSLAGRTAVSRGGLSLLTNVGLRGLVGKTADEYVGIAVELARDRSRLADLRRGLRERLLASPVMNGSGFARDFEEALRQMWRNWCRSARTS